MFKRDGSEGASILQRGWVGNPTPAPNGGRSEDHLG